METYGYIYMTTNLVNGKRYIGRHKYKDWDYSYYGSGKYLKRAIKKYGIENFTCFPLAWAWNENELNKLEIDYIAHYRPEYNLTKGGDGNSEFGKSNFGKKHTERTKQKMSEAKKNMTNETKQKISESLKRLSLMKGKHLSDETRKKMSEAHKLLKGEMAPHFGFSHSEKTKQKIREGNLNKKRKPFSDEHKQKMSEARKNYLQSKKQIKS
jgi:group I intron endonuclease